MLCSRCGQEVPEAQIDRQAAFAESFKWIGVGAQVVLQPAVYLAMAGIFLVVFRMIGSEIDFRRSLTVVVHGMMPFAIATLLAIPAALSRAELSKPAAWGVVLTLWAIVVAGKVALASIF